MKLYFFTQKLGSLRKQAFSTTLNHLPYTLFRYSLLDKDKKEKARTTTILSGSPEFELYNVGGLIIEVTFEFQK